MSMLPRLACCRAAKSLPISTSRCGAAASSLIGPLSSSALTAPTGADGIDSDVLAALTSSVRRLAVVSTAAGASPMPGGVRFLSTLADASKQQSSQEGEVVTFLTLNNIGDNPGAIKKKRRIGRGIGSSKGKTSGRGHKGQKARAGRGVHPTFEGGQTKLYKLFPKRGFKNVHGEPMVPINVGTLQDYVDMGRLVPPGPSDPPLTIRDLVNAGITKKSSVKHGIKLLGKGQNRLRAALRIEVSRASDGAISAIERAGGEITTVHYNKLALKALLKPERFDTVPRRARPPPKLMQYYTSYEKRGYLAPEIQLKKVQERLGSSSKDGGEKGKEE